MNAQHIVLEVRASPDDLLRVLGADRPPTRAQGQVTRLDVPMSELYLESPETRTLIVEAIGASNARTTVELPMSIGDARAGVVPGGPSLELMPLGVHLSFVSFVEVDGNRGAVVYEGEDAVVRFRTQPGNVVVSGERSETVSESGVASVSVPLGPILAAQTLVPSGEVGGMTLSHELQITIRNDVAAREVALALTLSHGRAFDAYTRARAARGPLFPSGAPDGERMAVAVGDYVSMFDDSSAARPAPATTVRWVALTTEGASAPMQRCQYDEGTVTTVRQDLDVVVYDATTMEERGRVSVPGGETGCPGTVLRTETVQRFPTHGSVARAARGLL